MIFKYSLKIFFSLLAVYFFSACNGDADKFRQAVIAGDLEIQEISVNPPLRYSNEEKILLNAGQTLSFQAKVKQENGLERDFTDTAIWSTSDTNIATVSKGSLTAKQDGEITVKAEFAGYADEKKVTVRTVDLKSITIQGSTQIDACQSVQFTAIGQYADTRPPWPNLDVNWSLSSEDIATVSNEGDTKGLLTTNKTGSQGTVDIIAVKDDVPEAQTLTINNTLKTIAVTPQTVNIAKDNSQQLIATATYEDNSSTPDISSNITWKSNSEGVAKVDSAGGLVTGVAKGEAEIVGACGEVVSNAVKVTVTAPTGGDAIQINEGSGRLTLKLDKDENKKEELELTLTLVKSGAEDEDVTDKAEWSVVDETVISVSNAGDRGVITIIGVGTAQVKAEYKKIDKTAFIEVTVEP